MFSSVAVSVCSIWRNKQREAYSVNMFYLKIGGQ